ncbi:MAG TPA: Npt1/Npt2 family nucleotide transporter [Vicinamibacteria bacterium]|nr:Npt1/Npt2 family nucleotide transporter [Vicinamibacteria bacterium]
MNGGIARRLLAPLVQVRDGESATALWMFAYSFLAMTAYNVVKPATRSKFIADLGADNLPYVQLAAGALIGVAMHFYGWVFSRLPRRWALPITQAGLAGVLVAFRALEVGTVWESVAFYFLGLILGILLISQFWTLANDVFDARQAKRLFGFIGGGASLGGVVGAGLTTLAVKEVGTENLLLLSAGILLVCAAVVSTILRREAAAGSAAETEGVGGKEALRLLRESRHLQLIALVIGFAAIGAAIIEQQLNMAAEAFKGREATDDITGFLAQVTFYLSAVGFAVQVLLTSRIHRRLGIGFALLVLPASLGVTGLIMLLNAALWAPALARILDSAMRYTVDKTTREILFLPLPAGLKERAKPFVDVTVDRVAKGLGALMVLVLIKPWGLGLTWQQVSYASLAITGLWMFAALRARREYLDVFRASLERRRLRADDVRVEFADLSAVETLVEELADPDEERVLNAIELLEALDKRNLVTPLLLRHESPRVRARALHALESARPSTARRLLPVIEAMLKDESVEVRGAAVHALHVILRAEAADILRPHLTDRDPRVAVAAAVALAEGGSEADRGAAEETLRSMAADLREAAAAARLEVARGIGQLRGGRLADVLVQLMGDASVEVARQAIRSVEQVGAGQPVFVAGLVALLGRRPLKADAREVLVAYGEPIVAVLAHFLADPAEDPWVRRHIPGTLALIPCQASMDAVAQALGDADSFLGHKAAAAAGRLRRERPDLAVDARSLEELILREARRSLTCLSLLHNLERARGSGDDSLAARTLREKVARGLDRIYRLLGLVYPPTAVLAARAGIERGDARARAAAAEYLDSLLSGPLRRWLLPLIDEAPREERVRQANALLRTRVRDVEETLAQLVHDDDPIVSAAAILMVERLGCRELTDDLTYVLEHRPAHDWQAFEAASWTLAGQRLSPETRRRIWTGPMPAVVLADRLRAIPLLANAPVDELLRIAAAGHQVRLEPGRVLCRKGAVPAAVQLLFEGRVVEGDGLQQDTVREAPAPLALLEALRGSPVAATVVARDSSLCLVLDAEPFLAMLADNIQLAQGLFRTLLDEAPPSAAGALLRGPAGTAEASLTLTPLERVRRLGACPLFARATVEQLLELAPLAREVPLAAGTTLFEAGEESAVFVLVEGRVRLNDGAHEESFEARPGDTLGALESLAGVRSPRRAVVTAPGRALRLGREELLDLLEGRVDLLQLLFAALLSERGALATPESTPRDRPGV